MRSSCDAWAVGAANVGGVYQTLIEHWNGRAWSVVPSPNPSATQQGLDSVSVLSARDAWAVGNFYAGGEVPDPRRALEREGVDATVEPDPEPER